MSCCPRRFSCLILLAIAFSFRARAQDAAEIFRQGETALAERRYADAAAAYEKLRKLDPNTAELHAKLGMIYFQQGDFDQATRALRQALKLKPGLTNADTLLALSLGELGRFRDALPGLEKAFRKSSDPALNRLAGLQLQRAYTGLRQDDKAVEVSLELFRRYPKDPEVLYHSGRVFGNFAFLTMQSLAEVAPDSVWKHQAEGEAYESQGMSDRAAIEYRQVLSLDPNRPGIHYRLGRALLTSSRTPDAPPTAAADAAEQFAQELHLDPSNANAAYELAEFYRKSGNFENARSFFDIALKGDPEFEQAHIGIARVLAGLGKPALALPHLEKATALNPLSEVAFYQLAQVHAALGNEHARQTALAQYQRLRGQNERERNKDLFSAHEVTRQELEPVSQPPLVKP